MVDKDKLLFGQPMDFNKASAIYIKKQETSQSFATKACIPISLIIMVCTGTKHAVVTGLFNEAYKIWKKLPDEEHTCPKWKS